MDAHRIAAMGLGAAAALGLLAGCGSNTPSSSSGPTAGGGTTGTTTDAPRGWRVYADPTEPAATAGPDIRSVAVSDDATDVRFRVRFASPPPLKSNATEGWTDVLLIGIDVPPIGPAPKPNEWRGVDYVLGMHGDQAEMRFRSMKASGPQLTRLPVTVTGPVIEFAVARTQLGNPARLTFNVAAGREGGPATNAGDMLPATGTFTYTLSAAGS